MRFRKSRHENDLGARLHRDRPQPRAEFMQHLTDRVAGESRRHRAPRARIAAVGIALAAMLVAFGAFGGIGYAASAVKSAVLGAKTVVVSPLESRKSDSKGTLIKIAKTSSKTAPSSSKTAQNSTAAQNNSGSTGNDNKAGKGDDGGKPDEKQYGHKVKVCVDPGRPGQRTVEVPDSAVPVLLAHGAHLGECRRDEHHRR